MRIVTSLVVTLLACIAIAHADITGRASVIGGDTLEVHGERVRLFGIDAPESRQLCTIDGERPAGGLGTALGAEHLTPEQLDVAIGDDQTKLGKARPDGHGTLTRALRGR